MRNPALYWFGATITALSLTAGAYDVSNGGGWLPFLTFGLFAVIGVLGMTYGDLRR